MMLDALAKKPVLDRQLGRPYPSRGAIPALAGRSHEQEVRTLEELPDASQEERRRRTIDNAMVEGQA